jgi:hypothetical protein
MDVSKSRAEISGKLSNKVFEKGGEIRFTDRDKNEEEIHRVKGKRNILRTIKIRKANWVGHILRGKCLLNNVIVGKIEVRIQVIEGQRNKA